MGGNSDDIDTFRKQINPDDRRNNRIELSFGPGYFYEGSSSNYSVRRFTSAGPSADVSVNGWLSPFFALHADYFTSLESSVASSGPNATVPLDLQNTALGVRFRKHFGLSKKAASLKWGVDYINRRTGVPGTTPDRVTTDTSGIAVSLQTDIPSGHFYSHEIGMELAPMLVHSEISDANVHSGGKNDTDSIGLWFGGRMLFDRHNQVFWNFKQLVEQSTFSGTASAPDPHTGLTPNGVSVTNSVSIFSIGFTWGD